MRLAFEGGGGILGGLFAGGGRMPAGSAGGEEGEEQEEAANTSHAANIGQSRQLSAMNRFCRVAGFAKLGKMSGRPSPQPSMPSHGKIGRARLLPSREPPEN